MAYCNKVGFGPKGFALLRPVNRNKYSPNKNVDNGPVVRDDIIKDIPAGKYQCKCCHCDKIFIGHRQDVLCEKCGSTPIKSPLGKIILESLKRMLAANEKNKQPTDIRHAPSASA